MPRFVNWNAIPDRTNLEAGTYRMKITSIKELPLDEKNSYLTFLAAFEVEEPKESAGEIHFERFRVGDDEDPLGDQEVTWKKSIGSRNLKKLLRAAGSPLLDTEEATYEAAKGYSFIGRIVKTPGRPGTQSEGQEFSNMRGYFSINSTEALSVNQPNGAERPAYPNGASQSMGGQEMTCAKCNAKISRADFGKHLAEHKKAEEQTQQA